MNKGVALARGEVVGILNADDVYAHEGVLEAVSRVFETGRAETCYGDLEYVQSRPPARVVRRWKAGPFRREAFRWGWMPPHPTFFVRRRLYEAVGGFDPTLGSAADYEFMLRALLKHRADAAYIPEVLVRMRTGGLSNGRLRARILANRMDQRAWRINGLRPYPWTVWLKPIRKLPQFLPKGGPGP
jgi:glycosyltransferase